MFNPFKKKNSEQIEKKPFDIPSNWEHHYIYGFISGNPYQTISDLNAVVTIFKNTVGKKGFIGIDSIFHPYNLVNPKGVTAWDLAWFSVYTPDNGKFIGEIAENKTATVVNAEALNLKDNYRVWPNNDLDPEINEQYSKYVPFVLPYLIYKNNDEPHWSEMIKSELELQGQAHTYIENFNSVFSKCINGHVMTLGFGEFDRENLDELIENFTSFYEKKIKN
ncbi:MAG: hypothetical protein K9J17_03245 [Flavobacteriales bacterium]|nr:hypothetical protein [Flavobacteriales bacterium]